VLFPGVLSARRTCDHRSSRFHVFLAIEPEFFFGLTKLSPELLNPRDQACHLRVKLLNLRIMFQSIVAIHRMTSFVQE
jgi:hypothetical protein